LAALNVKFRDVGYLWEIFMQAAFYGTPVLYPIAMVADRSETLAKVILVNPVAQVIQDARYVLVTKESVTIWSFVGSWKVMLPFAIIVLTLGLATYYFRRNQKYFAEQI
jgi:ABC-2 type transport system permease protein